MRNLPFIPFYNLPMISGSRVRIVEVIRLSLGLGVHAGMCEVQKVVEKSLFDLTPIFPTFSNPLLNLNFYINADPGSTDVSINDV